MERQREKEKAKSKASKQGNEEPPAKEGPDIDLELRKLEQEVAQESRGIDVKPSSRQLESTAFVRESSQVGGVATLELPRWVEYPWMYSRPTKNEFLDSWLRDWCDLMLKWCQFTVRHIVGLKDFKTSKPFDRLPEKELREVLSYIVDRGLGKWIDKEKTVARIMWRSIEEWANELYDWAYNNGVEVLDVFVIKSASRGFSTLPIPDIRSVMEIMAKNKQVKWIDKNREQAKLIYQ